MSEWLKEHSTVAILVVLYLICLGLHSFGVQVVKGDHEALLAAVLLSLNTGKSVAKPPVP